MNIQFDEKEMNTNGDSYSNSIESAHIPARSPVCPFEYWIGGWFSLRRRFEIPIHRYKLLRNPFTNARTHTNKQSYIFFSSKQEINQDNLNLVAWQRFIQSISVCVRHSSHTLNELERWKKQFFATAAAQAAQT